MDPFGTLSFGSEHSEFPVQLGVSVSSCHEGPVSFKTLTLFPRYLLSNNTGATLQFQECTQKGSPLHTESHHLLGPGESEGFYFRSPDHCLRVCEHPLWTAWSGPFSVVETDYVILELKAKEVRPNRLLFATIFTEGPTISISVQDYEQQPPYLLINELTTRVLVTQNDCVYAVEPQERYSFVLNQPGAEKGILTLAIGSRDDPLPLDLSEISTKPRFQHLETSLGKILLVTQRAGEVTTLRVTQNLADLPPEKAPLKTLRAVLDLPSIGLSLINFFPEEVCHLTASNLVFELESSDREVQVQGKLLDFQIDNSLPGPSYSRLLHRHSAKSQEPTVQIVALIERGDPGQAEKGVLEFRQLTVVTQSLSVALDNRVVTELAAFGQGLSHFITKASQVSSKLQKTSLPLTSPRKYFLNHFGLASTKVFLTTKASPEVLEESGLLSLPLSPTSPAKSMVMSAFLSNLRGLPLTFSPLEMHQILLTRDAFFVIVKKHFKVQSQRVLHILFGSSFRPHSLLENLDLEVPVFTDDEEKSLVSEFYQDPVATHDPDNLISTHRRRWPRHLHQGLVIPFDSKEALGTHLLSKIKEKIPILASEVYHSHHVCGEQRKNVVRVLMLTNESAISICFPTGSTDSDLTLEIEWVVALRECEEVVSQPSGVIFKSKGQLGSGRILECFDAQLRQNIVDSVHHLIALANQTANPGSVRKGSIYT